jgi:outer membrane protein assembly factor BamE (lipoprotein component of BamABCDE complex)
MSVAGAEAPATSPSVASPASTTPAPSPTGSSTAPAQTTTKEIKLGMTALEVVDVMGKPEKQLTFGSTEKWIYPDLTVLLENGKVKDVEF